MDFDIVLISKEILDLHDISKEVGNFLKVDFELDPLVEFSLFRGEAGLHDFTLMEAGFISGEYWTTLSCRPSPALESMYQEDLHISDLSVEVARIFQITFKRSWTKMNDVQREMLASG